MPRPRKGLSQQERDVNERLRQAREKLNLSQAEFAKNLDIKRERLNNYEGMRAALPLSIGLRACKIFILGEPWLALNQGHWRRTLFLDRHPNLLLNLLTPNSIGADWAVWADKISFSEGFKYFELRSLLFTEYLDSKGKFIIMDRRSALFSEHQITFEMLMNVHIDNWKDIILKKYSSNFSNPQALKEEASSRFSELILELISSGDKLLNSIFDRDSRPKVSSDWVESTMRVFTQQKPVEPGPAFFDPTDPMFIIPIEPESSILQDYLTGNARGELNRISPEARSIIENFIKRKKALNETTLETHDDIELRKKREKMGKQAK